MTGRICPVTDVACSGPFAAPPAPTGTARLQRLCSTCGSGRAREEAGGWQHNFHRPSAKIRFW
ncbi:hypothetical protein DBL05_08360 [Pseudomonas putida]|nr:hypothetical protein DBL05_08360 [Pseudomonas putida]